MNILTTTWKTDNKCNSSQRDQDMRPFSDDGDLWGKASDENFVKSRFLSDLVVPVPWRTTRNFLSGCWISKTNIRPQASYYSSLSKFRIPGTQKALQAADDMPKHKIKKRVKQIFCIQAHCYNRRRVKQSSPLPVRSVMFRALHVQLQVLHHAPPLSWSEALSCALLLHRLAILNYPPPTKKKKKQFSESKKACSPHNQHHWIKEQSKQQCQLNSGEGSRASSCSKRFIRIQREVPTHETYWNRN